MRSGLLGGVAGLDGGAGRAVPGLAIDGRADPDLTGLDRPGPGEGESKDAVLARRGRLVGLEAARQRDRTAQRAAPDLLDDRLALDLFPLVARVGANGQGTALDRDIDVLGPDTGKSRLDEQGICGRCDIKRQGPAELG